MGFGEKIELLKLEEEVGMLREQWKKFDEETLRLTELLLVFG
jgi:hypothetical protein